jgi:hypothetical protein
MSESQRPEYISKILKRAEQYAKEHNTSSRKTAFEIAKEFNSLGSYSTRCGKDPCHVLADLRDIDAITTRGHRKFTRFAHHHSEEGRKIGAIVLRSLEQLCYRYLQDQYNRTIRPD